MNHNTLLKNFIKGRRLAEFENTLKDCPLSDITITLHDCIDLNNPNFPSETHAIMSSLLIHKGLDLNSKHAGDTALLTIAKNCHNASCIYTVMAVELIKAGADVNILDTEGKSALFHCFKSNVQPLLIQTLIDSGSDLNLRVPNNGEFSSPVPEISILACSYWNGKSFFNQLVEKGATMTNEEIDYLKSTNRPLSV
jgi:ankyrin repeat protein